jgi:thiamine-phosphate pyrophosphorylase
MPSRDPSDRCRLYLITPPVIDDADAFAATLAEALDGGDVACLQLRLKPADDATIRRVAEALVPVAQARDVAVLMNDRPDLALATGCDGVHVGQEDTPLAEARRILGDDRIVGVPCHDSRHLAMEAGEGGADYVAFGAFFPTDTKQARTRADIDLLRWWAEAMVVPVVAIGGITPDNARPLIEAGADFLAVSSGVWDWPGGPRDAVARLNALMEEASPEREVVHG